MLSTETNQSQVKNQKLYDPSKSGTASKKAGYAWKISYGDGSNAHGNVYTDRVAVGNVGFFNQTVETAVAVSSGFTKDDVSSGLLGLGLSSGNTVRPQKALTFMDNLRSGLREPLFTADLKRGSGGGYNFGYIDKDAYSGAIQYAPIRNDSFYWQFFVTGYSIGKQPSSSMVPYRFPTIADTGTSLLLLPIRVLVDYYKRVNGSYYDRNWGAWVFPCASALPDFAFGVGNYTGVVPGEYINYGMLPNEPKTCYGGIQSSQGIGFSVFGDVLLKAQFVVFDLGNSRVGFANKKLNTRKD